MSAPKIVSRSEWKAEKPRAAMDPLKKGDVKRQVLHHSAGVQLSTSATIAAESEVVRAVQASHFTRGFSDIAYHYLVAPSGRIYEGRDPAFKGAGVYGENDDTVHVCVLGSYHIPSNKPSAKAVRSAAVAFRLLPGTRRKLYGHCEIGPSECPGANLLARKDEIAKLRRTK